MERRKRENETQETDTVIDMESIEFASFKEKKMLWYNVKHTEGVQAVFAKLNC